jgi:hypothetical protein
VTEGYTTLSGAQFQRVVGVDPAKWAHEFYAAWVRATAPETAGQLNAMEDRQAFIAGWFRDAMDAAAGVADRYRIDLEAAIQANKEPEEL